LILRWNRGGKFERFHQDGYELHKIADKETLFSTLEALINTIQAETDTEESVTSILNRVGVAPIFQRII
jgi:hypothetical protein